MRRGALLITQVQRATENERSGANDGISLEEYYQYLTDGQRFIQGKIIEAGSTRFQTSEEWSAEGDESRNLPYDILSPEAVVSLEYSPSTSADDFRRVQRGRQLERWSKSGVPFQYVLQGQTLKINAYPSAGTFRLTYQKRLPAIDKRRATVASRTLSSTAISALTLSGYTAADYDLFDHLTVVGWDGTIRMRGIPYTAVNSGTGVVTIQGSTYTFPTGSTAPVGDYVCLGEYATTHPQLDDQCESVLLLYCQKRILMRDSSDDAIGNDVEMQVLLAQMLTNYEAADIEEVPILHNGEWDCD